MTLSKVLLIVILSVAATGFASYFIWRPKPTLPLTVTANTCPVADNSQIMSELSYIKNRLYELQTNSPQIAGTSSANTVKKALNNPNLDLP